jgi:hypothetical protein
MVSEEFYNRILQFNYKKIDNILNNFLTIFNILRYFFNSLYSDIDKAIMVM